MCRTYPGGKKQLSRICKINQGTEWGRSRKRRGARQPDRSVASCKRRRYLGDYDFLRKTFIRGNCNVPVHSEPGDLLASFIVVGELTVNVPDK